MDAQLLRNRRDTLSRATKGARSFVPSLALPMAVVCLGALTLGSARAVAEQPAKRDPRPVAEVGQLEPLIPFHKDAIHATLVWDGSEEPRICYWMRPSEYKGSHSVDASVGALGLLRPEFERRVYGGFRFSTGDHGLDESVTTRIKSDIGRDNGQCLDLGHPAALAGTGKFRVEDLTEQDFALNAAAFTDAGHSAGLNYNIFCAGQSTLPDGRIAFFGGHDKGGNNGIRKVNVFLPSTRTWEPRAVPAVKRDYLADPTGPVPPNANPLNELNTDPPLSTDMKYQRWYPTSVVLPDGRVLILSGSDQDTSVGRQGAPATKVRIAVPEVYDPSTGTTIALENARKLFAMYPRSYVVQTGPGANDWKVAVSAEVKLPLPTDMRPYDPFEYSGKTYLLDVRGALADPQVAQPGENHWELLDEAQYAHESAAGAALWTLDGHGKARSQKVVSFGGDSGTGETVAAIEMIDFQAPVPTWTRQQDLVEPATQNNAVVLPDGKVLVMGGRSGGRGPAEVNSFAFQLFNPKSGSVKRLVDGTVPRHDHSTALLLPDASVMVMGGNRTDLVPGGTSATRNAGVPVGQIYKPPYFFQGKRPVITTAPGTIAYGQRFQVETAPGGGKIESIVLSRIGAVTHNWDWDNRFVKLAVDKEGEGSHQAMAPALPGLAVPGAYMMFAVDEAGVPSVAKRVMLTAAP